MGFGVGDWLIALYPHLGQGRELFSHIVIVNSFRLFAFRVVALWSALAVSGCSTSTHSTYSAKTPPPLPTSAASDSSSEKLARAHAHYAAGVILEMQGEMDGAL